MFFVIPFEGLAMVIQDPREDNQNFQLAATKIEKNLHAFYEVGFALMQIRDNRLYRESYK
jgi:hypothetical protein